MKREWRDPNHQKVDSGLKIFDKQVDCLNWDGNVIGAVQHAFYIRAFDEIECNGKADYEPGYLQGWDLKNYRIGSACEGYIKGLTSDKASWWTRFFYRNSAENLIMLCEIVAVNDEVVFSYVPWMHSAKQLACASFLINYVKQGLEDKRNK